MDTHTAPEPKKQKKKRDKVRSAWISFAGRIAAQMVGAIATVGLGVVMLNRYAGPNPLPQPLESRQPAITVIVVSPASDTPPSGAAAPAPASGITEQQTEMARAIARAISAVPLHVD